MSTPLPNQPEPVPPPADDLYAGVPGVLDPATLDSTLDAYVDPGIPEPDGWRIDGPEVAEWAMAKLAEAERTRAQLTEQRNAQMERAETWWVRVTRQPARTAAFMRGHLEDYALRVRALSGDRTKTVVLASGEVATRKAAAEQVDITDPDAVLAWAKANAPDIVTVKEHVTVTALRTVAHPKAGQAVTESGEVVPGTTVTEPGDPTATVKPYTT